MTEQVADKPTIPFDDFIKLDLRVAVVKACEPHPNADRLLKIQLDDGTAEGRQVCAGIKAWYEPESLIGKQVIIVANLEPRLSMRVEDLAMRKIRGEMSQGMILAASEKGETDDAMNVVVLTMDKPVKAGSSVS